MSAPRQVGSTLESAVQRAVETSAAYLAGLQASDGHWCAELTADSTLESDYILFQLWLYPPGPDGWKPKTRPLIDKAVRSILARQAPDGGFPIYPGGPSEVSASVKAYFALKLSGIPADDARMEALRRTILDLGGLEAANSYVKINLSLFGLYPSENCPSIPPEMVLLPARFIYRMSSWTRAIAVSLSLVRSGGSVRPAPAGFTLDELRAPERPAAAAPSTFQRRLFLAADRAAKWWERRPLPFIRRRAIAKAKDWMLARLEDSEGLGAIYPPMMYSVMALDALGYAPDDPVRVEAVRQFDGLMVDDGERFFFQPCFSPVWDTAIAAYALSRAEEDSAVRASQIERASGWLLEREIRRPGDWVEMRPGLEPSGWAFEYRNDFYPDIDDTAMALLALAPRSGEPASKRAVAWLLGMQSRDGGWAAFDADNDWSFLADAPFADHNAMLDPACPDITGRVLEALSAHGVQREHSAMRRGVDWLVRHQEADGSWYGRWGVAYIYGTCFALRGLAAAGEDNHEAHVLRGGEWLRSVQNADGGWGESCASYSAGVFSPGESAPSQTAWAIMGLIAGGDMDSSSVRNGVGYLVRTQGADGSWAEDLATGTGFPGVFYLKYGLYKDYFPLLALAEFRRAQKGQTDTI